jgi:PAS domain S-box-containing protein
MKDHRKTKVQLIEELEELRQRLAESNYQVAELKAAQSHRERVEKTPLMASAPAQELDLVVQMVETAPRGVLLMNREGQITFANDQVQGILGLEVDEIVGRPHNEPDWQVADEAGRPLPDEQLPFSRVMATGQPVYDVCCIVKRPDSQRVLVSVNGAPVLDQSGQVGGGAFTIEDITERRGLQHKLRQSEERLQALLAEERRLLGSLVENLPEGVLLLDGERRLVLANPVGEALLRTLTDVGVGDVLHSLGEQPLQALLEPVVAGKAYHEISLEGPPHRVFEVVPQPREKGPGRGGWVLVIRDVTQERETQDQVAQQQRLAAMGQLAAGIAHDFNNVLQGIISFSELLVDRPDVPETAKQHLGFICELGERAARMNRQILDFTRQSVPEKRSLDLIPFARGMLDLLRRTIPEKIDFSLDHDPGELRVHADTTQLQQVLINLGINARDAMPEGGRLTLRLERLSLQPGEEPPHPEMAPGEWIRLAVTDTGMGIPSEIIPKIYEPFFTTKEKGHGTGLGLAQVYGIVRQHEGQIQVDSEVGKGTTFSIYLPALQEGESEVAEESETASRGQGQIVLLVEDEPTVLRATSAVLDQLGYRVLATTEGHKALQIYEQYQEKIALVMVDMLMPGMDGIHLFHALKTLNADVKVIITTGYPLEDEENEFLAEGIAGCVLKPVHRGRLAQVVNKALQDPTGLSSA